MSAFTSRLNKDCPWCHQPKGSAKEVGKLKGVLSDVMELFDNYGFADESPCVRDREIVAKMRAAVDGK